MEPKPLERTLTAILNADVAAYSLPTGEDAPIHAAMRADELMETGDMDGRAVRLRIVKAVEELLLTLVLRSAYR